MPALTGTLQPPFLCSGLPGVCPSSKDFISLSRRSKGPLGVPHSRLSHTLRLSVLHMSAIFHSWRLSEEMATKVLLTVRESERR